MSRNWAFVIGINDYVPSNFAPLTCAKRDAEAMRDFFVEEAKFEGVWLFTCCVYIKNECHGTVMFQPRKILSNVVSPRKKVKIPGGLWLRNPDQPPKRAMSQAAQAND